MNAFPPSETNIFISYRRVDGLEHARIIYLELIRHGYSNIFFDYDSLRDGAFDSQIEIAIKSCNDFILILSPQSMNRCYITDDWVAHELRLAMKYSRKIIPVCINNSGFNWPSNFPSDLKWICTIQRHLMLTNEYFSDSMRRLALVRLQTKPTKTIRRGNVDFSTKVESKALPLLRDTIKKWGTCRLASFNDKGQGVIVKEHNCFVYTNNIPEGMKSVLNSIKSNPYACIAEVGITEYYWFVIYKDSSWHGKGYVPERFKKDLNWLFHQDALIRSIAMDDNGDYIVVTNNSHIATRYKDQELIRNAKKGRIISAHITNDGALINFERGTLGYCVPTDIIKKLNKIVTDNEISPKLIRYTDGGLYLFADEDSYCTYM